MTIQKGRGATGNPANRYQQTRRVDLDDGWPRDGETEPLVTTLTVDASKSIISYNRSPDIPFDRSVNPYRGCEHGCVYCFARPTHAWLDLSPGLDFESRLFYKPAAANLLEKALSARRYRCLPIALGVNTDAYQPVERRLRITRSVLEVLDAFNHPVVLVTKSALVERDLDVLGSLAARNLVQVLISVTTLDPDLARRLEPRAPTPRRRLDTIRALAGNGIPVGMLVAPVIPVLTDAELENILRVGREAGAGWAGYVLLRLPLELGDMFRDWLECHVPDQAAHVMGRLRGLRGGKENQGEFGTRMRGTGVYAEMLEQRFRLACRRNGLGESPPLDIAAFRVPGPQPDLFR